MVGNANPSRVDGALKAAPPFDLYGFIERLFPVNRSLTGAGVRQTLEVIGQHIELATHEVESGTPVLDWEVPLEWNIRGAHIKAKHGRCLVDFADNNLHVLGYSKPIKGIFPRAELAKHIHTLPEQPDLIPYRTGYFADDWGFCLPHRLWQTMTDDSYHVEIDSSLSRGHLSFGEVFLPGTTEDEILISCHICHPSLANDNLSGVAIATAIAKRMAERERRFGYRFLFLPATIGALTWLARNERNLARIKHGLVLTCLGDPASFHYKQSRRGSPIDRAVEHVLRHSGLQYEILPFDPYGYDERQFCSPGFNLPVGCLMRSVHGTFPEYHTSADNLDFVTSESLGQSFTVVSTLLDVLERNHLYERVDGRGEPQLGRRGLYRAIAGQRDAGGPSQMDLLWVLNLADGKHSLLDMAIRADVPFMRIDAAARLAADAALIRRCD